MLRDFKTVICLKKTNILLNIVMVTFGILLVIFAARLLRDEGFFYLQWGFLTASIVAVCMCVKWCMSATEVPRGLSFGITRYKLFIWSRVWDFLELVIIIFPVVFCLKDGFYPCFKLVIILFGFAMWLEGLAGNSVIRFGMLAFWSYYVTIIAAFVLTARVVLSDSVAHYMGNGFFGVLLSTGSDRLQVWAGIMAFVAAGLLINWLTFRKIEVIFIS